MPWPCANVGHVLVEIDARHGEDLDVGIEAVIVGMEEAAGLDAVRRDRPRFAQKVLQAGQPAFDALVDAVVAQRLARICRDRRLAMIHEIGADARQVDKRLDAEPRQVVGRPEAREHQQLGCRDGPGRKNDLAVAALFGEYIVTQIADPPSPDRRRR
jgi:hypothetical protein